MPGLTVGDATFDDHVLTICGVHDHIEAQLRMPDVDVVAIPTTTDYGTSPLPAGVGITPSDFPDEKAVFIHNHQF